MWQILAFGSAFVESWKGVAAKRAASNYTVATIAFSQRSYAALILAAVALVSGISLDQDRTFWIATAASTAINAATTLLEAHAFSVGPLSQAAPLAALSPVFLILTGWLIAGEILTGIAILGIAISVFGVWLLQAEYFKDGWLAPFKSIWRQPASRAKLAIVVLWSISAPLDKVAVSQAGALTYAAVREVLLAACLLPFACRWGDPRAVIRSDGVRRLAPVGILSAGTWLLQVGALALTATAHVISTKRLSVVFSVLWGWWCFKEESLRTRLSGALVLCAGSALILLFGR